MRGKTSLPLFFILGQQGAVMRFTVYGIWLNKDKLGVQQDG